MTPSWSAFRHRLARGTPSAAHVAVPAAAPEESAAPHTAPGSALGLRGNDARACLDAILGASIDGIIVCDADDRVVLFSSAAERMFGVASDAAVGRCLTEFLPELPTASAETHQVRATRADAGTFAAELSVSPPVDGSGLRSVIVRDLSELSSLEAQLRQAQKMDALGQLAGGVAHDFNNLLTVIFGNLDLARREVRDRPSTAELLGEVERASMRAAELTRQLLSFSRKRVLEQRVLSVDQVVRNAERLFRRVLPESVILESVLAADPHAIRADAGQFEQALMNLVVNSRDAMPRGGSIVIESGIFELSAEQQARYPELPPGRYVTLSVRDTGVGMTDAVRQRVFEPFFTTKPLGQGTGLGLTMAYGIVTQAGGTVRLESAPGRGTTVTLYLPAVEGEVATDVTRPRTMLRGTETILLVEDEAAVRASTRRMLERSGYTVLEARHGGDALALWRAERSRIALVLSDVRMPLMGGAEVVREIRHDAPDAKFLLMSGYAEVDASPFLAELSVPFIEKPFTLESLLQRVREVLDAPVVPMA